MKLADVPSLAHRSMWAKFSRQCPLRKSWQNRLCRYTDRKCSKCAAGWASMIGSCHECNDDYRDWLIGLGGTAVTIAVWMVMNTLTATTYDAVCATHAHTLTSKCTHARTCMRACMCCICTCTHVHMHARKHARAHARTHTRQEIAEDAAVERCPI